MPDQQERMIEGYRVVIDRNLCVGFGDCVHEGPQVFELDDENVAVFVDEPRPASLEHLFMACRACPVDALSVWDQDGRQMLP